MVEIADPVAAFCFDRAVSVFGNAVERDIEESTKGKKEEIARVIAENVVAKWTGGKLKFADPVPTR